jgi:hypothetical protein
MGGSKIRRRPEMFQHRNMRPVSWLCFALLPFPLCAQTDSDQPSITYTGIRGSAPAQNAHIVKYYVGAPSPGSRDETGSLHIFYSDKTEISDTFRPRKKISDDRNHVVYNQRGITDVKTAPDKRTIGWAETIDNAATSYSIPYVLAIYRSGQTILHIEQGQMLWFWTFRDGGKHIAAVWGATHGPEVGDYQLYDARTGRLLSEVFGDPATQSLSADAPEWAKEAERQK